MVLLKFPFLNGTEIFEIGHPLCSGDKNDICVSPDTAVGFSFYAEYNR